MARGFNWGILSLLGVVVMVLGGITTFFVFLGKKSAAVAAVSSAKPPATGRESPSTDNFGSPPPLTDYGKALGIHGEDPGLPVLASQQGKDVDNLILYVHLLMIVLFAAGCLLRLLSAPLPTRAQPQGRLHRVKGHASNYIEGAVAVVEASC